MQAQFEKIRHSNSIHFFERTSDRFLPFWHYHPEIELTLIVQGKGLRFVGDSIAPYQAMDLVLVGENTPHHWVSSQFQKFNPQQAYVIQFQANIFQSIRECEVFLDFFKKAKRGIYFSDIGIEVVALVRAFEEAKPIKRIALLLELIEQLMLHPHQQLLSSIDFLNAIRNSDARFEKVNHLITTKLDQKISLAEIAESCHMTPQSFCRWFKKRTGSTFISYLNTIKVETGCQMLMHTSLSIQEISFQSGFETASHFNRIFKSLKGSTPSKFRKQNSKVI